MILFFLENEIEYALEGIKCFEQLSQYIRDTFIDNMDSFLLPHEFNDMNQNNWFIPPVLVNMVGAGIKFEDYSNLVILEYGDSSKKLASRILLKNENYQRIINDEILNQFDYWVTLGDFLFSKSNRSNLTYKWIRNFGVARNIKFLELF